MGDSGTGKTTFVLDQLPELWQTRHQRSLNLHIGLENVLNWLIAKPKDSDEILFLDEANLEDEGSLEFLEGLFNQPPGILYKGIFIHSVHTTSLL
ncbi:MAG: hypothetical protein HWD59_09750 [Coxiellaceae bacterium]|nr:MAG: hypothetical protein HWD59_09750 [Coxiellaceae bacterium]